MGILSKKQIRELIQEKDLKTAKDAQETLKEMFKDVIQELLEAELDQELGFEKNDRMAKNTHNSRNGKSKKTVRSEMGSIELDIPRDRQNEFEPQVVQKHSRDVSGIEDIVISMYARGMSTRDIHLQIKEIYGVDLSAEMVSKMTDRILPKITEWQNRQLEHAYPLVFMDAIHYKVRENNLVKSKAAYVIIGVNLEGYKDILGVWIGETESSKFWLTVLNDLKNRGIQEVAIFSVDGLTGLKEAIQAVYSDAEIQRCIIHQLRNSFRFVSYKHRKEFTQDFKAVYQAPNESVAIEQLDLLKEKWGSHYPYAFKSWEENWDVLSTFLKFPEDLRKIMYTTNVIENLNRQYRKVTKSKAVFPSDTALLKMLYLVSMNAKERWTSRYRNWDKILNQLLIFYPTLNEYL